MRIAIFGSSGFIGRPLAAYVQQEGHTIRRFVRINATYLQDAGQVPWNPATNTLAERDLEDCDAVINLCGSRIGKTRWTKEAKLLIRDSRVRITELICNKLAGMEKPPSLLLNASAIGFYGTRSKEDKLDEGSPSGEGFLAEMCRDWEGATGIAQWAGIRVIHMRTGLVMGGRGGFLRRVLPFFKAGLGARFGNGNQCMSWIAIDDFVNAVGHLLKSPQISMAVNMTAPRSVTNAEFTDILSAVVNRKARFSMPGQGLQLALGELARETILGGQNVVPKKLLNSGFVFKHESLEPALRSILKPGS